MHRLKSNWRRWVKRSLLAMLCVFFGVTALNFFRLYVPLMRDVEISSSAGSTSANSGDVVRGRYALFTRPNGILEFPFCFGDRTFLYDIERDRYWEVSMTTGLKACSWEAYEGKDKIFCADSLYVWASEYGGQDGYVDLKRISLNAGKVEKLELGGVCPLAYSTWRDTLYYVKGSLRKETTSALYALSAGATKGTKLWKGYISSMAIFGDTLYWINPKTKEINLRDLRTGNTRIYKDLYDDAAVIREIDENRFAVFYESGRVCVFQNGKGRDLCMLKRKFYTGDTVGCRDGALFYEQAGKVRRKDWRTGTMTTLFDLGEIKALQAFDWNSENRPPVQVSYGEDYIFVVINQGGRKPMIGVFDYAGRAVRIRKV